MSCPRFHWNRIVPRSWRTDSMEGDGKTMIGAAGLVGSEGERSSSMLSITGQAAGAGPLAPGQRWSLARKHEVVLRLLRGEPVEAVSRQFGVPVWQLERWADRFAAAQALDLAIHTACGAVRADAARGLLLRHDHGSAFMSAHFQSQIPFLGLTPSFAFVRQPETKGVAERFIRTLKEQGVLGRIFRNAEEVRAAVRAFVARYNEHWLLEKNASRSPAQTRREWFAALAQ